MSTLLRTRTPQAFGATNRGLSVATRGAGPEQEAAARKSILVVDEPEALDPAELERLAERILIRGRRAFSKASNRDEGSQLLPSRR